MAIRENLQRIGIGDTKDLTEEQILKKTIKITYTAFYYIFLFLSIGIMGKYLFWNKIGIAVEIGIVIALIWMWKVKRAMTKKEREGQT